MSKKRPIFMFAFANDAQSSLRLGEEHKACFDELKNIHKEEKIEFQNIGHPTLEQISSYLNTFRDQIYILHYGGHSESKSLELYGAKGRSQYFSTPLGLQKNLKLVFLNGCNNQAQVDDLFQKGIPAVIATNANIEDKRAVVLARQFYQAIAGGYTIRESYEKASSLVKDKNENLDISLRCLSLRGAQENQFPWALYVQDETVLDWSIQSVEQESRLELMQKLRIASKERHSAFTDTKEGRFRHLNIKDSMLAGIKDIKNEEKKLIDDNIKLNDQQQSLHNSLPLLWKEACHHAMIVGPGGMGKTVTLLRLWERWVKKDDPMTPVPIFVQLNEFNSWQKEGFIENYIREYYVNLNIEELLKSSNIDAQGEKAPHIILLLDGLNEVTASSNPLLLEINRMRLQDKFPGVQILLTSRVDMREAHQWHTFQLLELQALKDQQISKYLQKEAPNDLRLKELLGNPMMLSIYGAQSELPQRYLDKNILKEEVSSTGEMLYNVEAIQRIKIEEQYSTDPSKQAFHRFILEHLLPFIGWEMQQSGIFFIQKTSPNIDEPGLKELMVWGVKNLINDDFFDAFEFFDTNLNEEEFQGSHRQLFNLIIKDIVVKELAILADDGENFRFLHQNFRDYFAARHVQNQIQICLNNKTFPQVLKKAPLDFYVRQILGEIEEEHTNQMEWDEELKRWQWSKEGFHLDNNLSKLLEQCKGIFDTEQIEYIPWNILTIWKEQRGELSAANLEQLVFKNFSFNNCKLSQPRIAANVSNGVLRENNFFFQGHSDWVRSCAFSSNGNRIVTASDDNTAKIWDAQSGQCLVTLKGHSSWVMSCAFSSNGNRIVTTSYDNTAKIWDAQSGQCLVTLKGHSDWVRSCAFSSNGNRIVTASDDKTAKIWDAQSGQCLVTLQGHSYSVMSCAFSSNGNRIVTASFDNTAKTWDAQSGRCLLTLQGHSSWVNSCAFSSNGNRIVTASHDKTAKIWDAQSGRCLLTLQGHSYSVNSCAFSSNADRIVTASDDNTAKIWDAQSGQCLVTLQGHSSSVMSCAFSSKGNRIVTASFDKTAKIWDAQSGQCLVTLQGHSSSVRSCAFSSKGNRIVTASDDKTAKIWDAQSGQCLVTLQGHSESVTSCAFSSKGNRIVTASDDKTAKVWDAHSGKCLITLPNIPGLFIQGCDFRNMHPDSDLSEESIQIMRQYGGIFNDEDERRWNELMEKHFGVEEGS